ncbi:MAG: hypothetical protein FH756_10830 [Firmicutes bacterium]|nr:hypothetical protein [Bacillota bacterium]
MRKTNFLLVFTVVFIIFCSFTTSAQASAPWQYEDHYYTDISTFADEAVYGYMKKVIRWQNNSWSDNVTARVFYPPPGETFGIIDYWVDEDAPGGFIAYYDGNWTYDWYSYNYGATERLHLPDNVTKIAFYAKTTGFTSYTTTTLKFYYSSNTYTNISEINSNVISTKTAAESAKASADAAHTDAQNAANRTWYNGNESAYWAYYGKVRAQEARDNAANAHTDAEVAANRTIYSGKSSAQWAAESKSSAGQAKTASEAAKNSADTAVSELQNGTYGLSATKTKLDTTYTKANTAASQSTTAVNELGNATYGLSKIKSDTGAALTKATTAANQTIYNGNSSAYWAYVASVNTGFDTIAPSITNIQGQNGATCTTNTSFTVVTTASDNGPDSNLRYRAICDGFDSGWGSSNSVTITD